MIIGNKKIRVSLYAIPVFFISSGCFAMEEMDYEEPSSFKKAFYDEGKLDLNTMLYIRYRSVKDPASGKYGMGPAGIQNQTGNVALNYISGYYNDVVGFDFRGGANIKLGNTRGQSEILYYDYDCNSSGVYSPCEKSYIAVSVAALKMKLGSDNFNYKIAAGYTPINSGTVRSSGGLNPHAFRGFESILTVNDLKLTYAWADEFKNDWSRNFETMTTSSNQNNATGLVDSNGNTIKKGKIIDYIHTAGVVYNFGSTKLDVGYGEGKGYRRNWQALIERNDALPADLFLKTKLFYQGARYIEELSGIKHPSAEYYAGLGFNLTHNNIVWSLGYSQNYSPDTSSYNFRLTPWANSDKRDYQTTLSQLEDYNVSGARALRAGISYNFASFNLPELTLGSAGTYGWHVVSDKNKRGSERQYHGKMYSLDLSARYFFDDGVAKGLSFTLLPALFRARDSNAKTDRNDVKLIVGYKTNIF